MGRDGLLDSTAVFTTHGIAFNLDHQSGVGQVGYWYGIDGWDSAIGQAGGDLFKKGTLVD